MIEKTTDTKKAPKGATSKKGAAKTPKLDSAPSMPMGPKQDGSMDDYEAKDAHETLMRAEGIKQNSDLMARVMKHHAKKKVQINSIDDLKHVIAAKKKASNDDLDNDGM